MRNGVAASRSLNSGASIHSSHSVAPTHHLNNGISTHTPLLKTSAANVVAADIANNFGNTIVTFNVIFREAISLSKQIHLQDQQWKHKNVRNIFEVNIKDTRTMSY